MKQLLLVVLFSLFGIQNLSAQCTEAPELESNSSFIVENHASCAGSDEHSMYFVLNGDLVNPNEAGQVETIIELYALNDTSKSNLLKTIVIPSHPVNELHLVNLADNSGGFNVYLSVSNNCGKSQTLKYSYYTINLFDLDFSGDSCYIHNYNIVGKNYFCKDFSNTTYTLSGNKFDPNEIDRTYYIWKVNGNNIQQNSHSIEVTDLQVGENEIAVYVGSPCHCGSQGNFLPEQLVAKKTIIVDPNCSDKILTGNIAFGLDSDCETLSKSAANVVVEINDGLFRTITDSLGNYEFNLPSNDYKISPRYYELCQYDTNITIPEDSIKDFTVLYYNNVETHISMGIARPGSNFKASISLFNESIHDINNATVEITYDGPMDQCNTIPNWNSVNNNSFTLKNIDLKAQDYTTIHFESVIDTNANIDDVIQLQAKLITPTNIYHDTNTTLVRNSYDPNDKQVSHEKVHIDDIGTRLHYQVRFQNTGNAPALKVVVTDTLYPLLDVSTLKIGSSSHDFSVNFSDNNVLVWTFNDINLPDSTSDFEGSQGYFTYSINMKSSVNLGDEINNTANIYFDFNPPIITNTTSTRIMNLTHVHEKGILDVDVYPNPTSNLLQIRTESTIQNIKVLSLQGKILINLKGHRQSVDISNLSAGSYFLTMATPDGQTISKQIFKR